MSGDARATSSQEPRSQEPRSEAPAAGRRVVLVSHTPELGGAERTLVDLSVGLRELGMDVHVTLPSQGPLLEAMTRVGTRTHVVRYGRWTTRRGSWRYRMERWRRNLGGIPRLRRLFRELDPDVVMSNTMTVPSGAFAARSLGIPHVWFVHEFGRDDHQLRFDVGFHNTLRLIDRLSRFVIVPSRANLDALAPWIPREKMTATYYVTRVEVDLEKRCAPTAPVLELLFIGAIKQPKGPQEAIEAVGELARRGRRVNLTLAGGGSADYVASLEARAAQLGVADRVRFAGFVQDPTPYFLAAHVGLVCSRRESLGRVTIEAMMHGCPVIGAASGGIVEVVRDGFNGLLYQPGNARDLADKIERIDRDRALIDKLGRAGYAWARESYSLERFSREVAEILLRAAGISETAAGAG